MPLQYMHTHFSHALLLAFSQNIFTLCLFPPRTDTAG